METKYICLECGEIFDEPKNYSEDLTCGYASEGGSFIHKYKACPYCEGAYRTAIQCDICEEYFNKEDIETVGSVLMCEKCFNKMEE